MADTNADAIGEPRTNPARSRRFNMNIASTIDRTLKPAPETFHPMSTVTCVWIWNRLTDLHRLRLADVLEI